MKPQHISVSKTRDEMSLDYGEGKMVQFSAEFLRVLSPSAEVQGHGPEQAILQTGKRLVTISQITAIGNYAIRIEFDDGHKTGIYSWVYLKSLADHHHELWQDYLLALEEANCSRDI